MNDQRPLVKGFTIDAPYSRDLDDALYLEKDTDGWKVFVTIADVASHVPMGGTLDMDAQERAFTRYFARSNVPMLPRDLSEKKLSLLPGRPRATITFEIHLDAEYAVKTVSIYRSMYRSRHKMSHAEVDALIDTPDAASDTDWKQYYAFAEALIAKRRNRGALVVYDLIKGILTNEEGAVVKREHGHYYRAYLIVQEFMILANCAVSEFLQDKGVPIAFRNHTTRDRNPDRDEYLQNLYGDDLDASTVKALHHKLATTFNRAEYGASNIGHFALNVPAYAHWTSPIRRYADLINHRMLLAWLDQSAYPYDRAELDALCTHINTTVNEYRDGQKELFKDKTLQELVAADEDTLNGLPEGMFSRFVELICRETIELTAMRMRVIVKRIEQQTISPACMTRIIFYRVSERKAKFGQTWRGLKLAALKTMARHAIAMVTTAHHLVPDWSEPTFAITGEGTAFSGTLKLTHGERCFESARLEGSSKREVQQVCCIDLLQILNMHVDPSVRPSKQPASKPKTLANAKGTLFELCQKSKWSPPKLSVTSTGPTNARLFTCNVTLHADRTHTAVGQGVTKKLAEQQACARILEAFPVTKTQKPKLSVTSNPISAIHEWAQQHQVAAPSTDFSWTGPDNERVFQCHMKIGKYYETGEGVSKKDAKTKAAQLIWNLIETETARS